MATVMFAWQLGTGLGHLAQMLPLARGLAEAGHAVFLAARDLAGAPGMLGTTHVKLLQAPAKTQGRLQFPDATNVAQLLGNLGFGDDGELSGLASAWRNLIHLVRPRLIVFDYSPAALLAARGLPVRRVLVGSGFCCPPDVRPLPAIRSLEGVSVDADRVLADEDRILDRANRVLRRWRVAPLQRLGQLFGEVDDCLLTTFPELDHFGPIPRVRYDGPINGTGGDPVTWPNAPADRSKVFAYLKPARSLPAVLAALRDLGWPSVVFMTDRLQATWGRFACGTLRFTDRRPDIAKIAAGCDCAILNGTHGTTCDLLLSGKPTLQVPLTGEQELLAHAVARMGAGVVLRGPRVDAANVRAALSELVSSGAYAAMAKEFAARHATFDPRQQREDLLGRLRALLD